MALLVWWCLLCAVEEEMEVDKPEQATEDNQGTGENRHTGHLGHFISQDTLL